MSNTKPTLHSALNHTSAPFTVTLAHSELDELCFTISMIRAGVNQLAIHGTHGRSLLADGAIGRLDAIERLLTVAVLESSAKEEVKQ